MTGTSFNQYQITGQLGAGGMGEVFRARDTRLKRDVAVKVLPKPARCSCLGERARLGRSGWRPRQPLLQTWHRVQCLVTGNAAVPTGEGAGWRRPGACALPNSYCMDTAWLGSPFHLTVVCH